MKFIERNLPILLWQNKAKQARLLPKDRKAVSAARKSAIVEAKRLETAENNLDKTISDISAFQFQIGDKTQFNFKALPESIDDIELKKNEVLFVPLSLAVNRYITYYNSAYFHLDIHNFVDPNNQVNSARFKTVPCWGQSVVYRSGHPDFKEGQAYYGFWPLSAYSIREIDTQVSNTDIAYLSLPTFEGPKEWLKIINFEGFTSKVADNYEYIKIGYTFALALRDMDAYGAKRLVLSSASSTSAQIIAMCVKKLMPDLQIVGYTSQRNLDLVKSFEFFDEVFLYEEIQACPNEKKSLYFDALGDKHASEAIFKHFTLSRWWVYGEGSEKTYTQFLKLNRKGTFYSNLVDSHVYQIKHDIKDSEIIEFYSALIKQYDLETFWGSGQRQISTANELTGVYQSFIDNTQPTGEKVLYRSPLLQAC
ncbi:DUF2855 family protein [Glaciecola siphonariae]|uniref:DUF2855 family protein n=1 Tax=Glaciecola siphonariae TaxID=521012 RepID=A0ABV9LS85_9ALTE